MGQYTETDLKQICAIAEKMLAGMIEKKEVDPNDDAAMEKAIRKCVREASVVYNAALEYLSG